MKTNKISKNRDPSPIGSNTCTTSSSCARTVADIGDHAVIVVFCGRNGKFAAAKFAPFRNLLQILLLFMKNLSFHHFKTEVFFFK